jgi:large subunit ribosomal protein L14
MIFRESLLRVADNSGARLVRCVGLTPPLAGEGDLLTVSVVRCRPRSRVNRGQLYRAVLVQCRRPSSRWGGVRVGFRSNRVVLLRRPDNPRAEPLPLGTRVLRPLSLAVRRYGFAKLLLLAPSLI